MRLEKLQVSGFGHLHGLQVELGGPVTVLYGPNEAGKSTLLGFVRAMLFGIPSRTYGPQRYEPVGGGTHGGMLAVSGDDGKRWLIERYAQPPEGAGLSGARGDRLRITRTGADGQLLELSQEEMQRELLGGMSKEMFRQLFAVSLTELQEVSALQSEEMSRFLFHAGIGGGAAVLRGEKKLVQEMDKLYRPRGRNQEIAQILQAVERLERQAGAAKSLLPRYQEVLRELKEVDAGLATVEAALSERGRTASLLKKAASSRPDWIRLEALRGELDGLPERSLFPEQGLSRWQSLQEEKERLRLESGELRRRIAALQSEEKALALQPGVLEREAGLRALAGRQPSYESGLQDLAGLRAEAEQMQGKLDQVLRSIHADWTAERLRAFAGTVGERETVRQYMSRFHAYDKEMDMLHNERYKLEREAAGLKSAYIQAAQRLEESKEAGRRQFADLVPAERLQIRELWNEISVLLDRWRAAAASRQEDRRAAEAEAAAQARVRSLYGRLLAGTAILTILLPAALWFTTKSGWSALLGGIVLLGFDVYLASGLLSGSRNQADGRRMRRRSIHGEAPLSSSPDERRLRELLPRLITHPLSAAGRVDAGWVDVEPQALEEEERGLRKLMENWQLWDQRHEALETAAEDCRFKAEGKARELEGLEREMSRRESHLAGLSQEWEEWLQERHLHGELSPEAALDVFRLAEQGRDWLGRLDSLSLKMTALQEAADAFERDCREWTGDRNGSPVWNASSELRRALAELEIQLDLKARRERLADKRIPLEEELGRNMDRQEAVQAAERHLLEESGAADGEAYLRYGAEAERKQQLQSELRQAELVLFSSMSEPQRVELEELLRGQEEEILTRSAEAARMKLEEAEAERRQLQERRGRLLQEQESLETRGLQEDLQQQLAEQQAALDGAVDRYAVMAVCNELITRVRKIYEEERQPQVLQAASAYLAEMTGGTYRRILMKMGSQELMAEHRDHGPISSSYLSRGTAEQLYLAMRLALSGAVSGQAAMPVLLDDLFVNFDAARMEGTLSVLKRISERHQVIMMTCHAHVVDSVKAQFPGAQIIEMS
ncbi:AAA family ATPase [Paenibacillus sp. FSL R5-0407]|uniref:AAA family ATPase n=1 Tax=Paenibacillus sp. FSL R5-0407 TaxID=2975320 RepID=UPI0030F903A9